MNNASTVNLCPKIARLVEERGWNQEEFARLAHISRLTVRGILAGKPRRLHNATVAACARALGLAVHDLRQLPLASLLERMPASSPLPATVNGRAETRSRSYEEATQPELLAWMQSHPDRAGQFSPAEMEELLSLQGTGGPLTAEGVEHFVDQIERKRRLLEKMSAIAGTEYIDLLEQLVDLLHEKIRPYRDRK